MSRTNYHSTGNASKIMLAHIALHTANSPHSHYTGYPISIPLPTTQTLNKHEYNLVLILIGLSQVVLFDIVGGFAFTPK